MCRIFAGRLSIYKFIDPEVPYAPHEESTTIKKKYEKPQIAMGTMSKKKERLVGIIVNRK
jgi:hypothetical protein